MATAAIGEHPKGLRLLRTALGNRKTAIMLVFGFAAGLPYTLLIGTLNAWLGEWEIEWFKNQVDVAVDGEQGVVLHYRQSGRLELPPDRLRVDTASVAGPVCEAGKCLEDAAARAPRLLIDVAFERP